MIDPKSHIAESYCYKSFIGKCDLVSPLVSDYSTDSDKVIVVIACLTITLGVLKKLFTQSGLIITLEHQITL